MVAAGCILAGGMSNRMGRDKAFLPIGSRPLIEIVAQRLRPFVERLVIIGNAHNLQRLRETLTADAMMTDVQPGYGPLMGIYTGLMHTETSWNLFLPCDMPWIDGRLIERLAGAAHGEAEIVASLHPTEGIQPFPLLCHVKACRTIGALLNRGERALQVLLRQPGAQLVPVNEPELWRSFTNVNTVADYAKLTEATVTR
jgi:molybdopterin-guanine dinucleotide biosynthesis protein A